MPCMQYAPVYDKVSSELSDDSNLEFHNIDARNDNTGLGSLLGVRSIPQTFVLDEKK